MPTAIVIDDNQRTADSLSQMLTLLGVEPVVAYGARAAMIMLNDLTHTPDIIFMDINMPGLDGFEVMAYLRRYPQLADVPVVFVTSDDQAETARKVRRTGALHLVIKPATVDVIEKVLQEAKIIPLDKGLDQGLD